MTRAEAVTIVDRVIVTWNQNNITMPNRKTMYEAWFRLLVDLDVNDANTALDEIVIEDQPWPPRVGTLRKRIIDNTTTTVTAPTPAEAWAQVRSKMVAAASGKDSEPLHPLVRAAVDKLGTSSEHALHTNGDREMFIKTYEALANLDDAQRYGLA